MQLAAPLSGGAYHDALHELRRWQLQADQLSRVSVDAHGTLQFEAETAGPLRWFAYTGGALRRVRPQDDRRIPLLDRESGRVAPFSLEVVSYRPGRRIVLTPADRSDAVVFKGYRKGRGATAVRNHEMAIRACKGGGFEVPSLVDYTEERDVLAMARRPGVSPPVSVGNAPVWQAIGAGLRNFQESCEYTGLDTFTCRDELEVLDELARRFELCDLQLPSSWQDGRDALGKLAGSLPGPCLGAAHRDLHDGQFLVATDGLNLLDFDLLCRADVALDPGNLLAHMFLRDLQRDPASALSNARACGNALLSGLGRQGDTGFEQRVLFYHASTLYRLALVYALRPRWHHLVPSLVHLGEERLREAMAYAY
ncbi:MAG: hypothetical protein R3228_14190 [Halioglobus sp.]|nr:hypothetical protein [Halioglobus sp.]